MLTPLGERRIPLLGHGKSVKVKDVDTLPSWVRFPLIQAARGSRGNTMTVGFLATADASLNNTRIPLCSGGGFVTVQQVRDFD